MGKVLERGREKKHWNVEKYSVSFILFWGFIGNVNSIAIAIIFTVFEFNE